MATNGWYVEKIITDLQSGKVDEFVKKEGKWFNYLKGEATTFTNAADAGSASGNIDFEEFSVQGIGAISGTPFVSGTTPALGGSIVVNVSGGVDWTSSGFSSYNISVLPSTGTFTITPENGNTVAASLFSELVLALPSYITSITFADTDTAYSNSNTVTGTINFDGSSLSSGVTTVFNLTLNPEAVASGILWQGSIGLFGQFYNGETVNINPNTYIGSGNASLNSASTIGNSLIYDVSALIIPSITSALLDITFTADDGLMYDPNVAPIININVPNTELSQYNVSIDDSDGAFSRRIIIDYIPTIDGAIDDNNYIDVFTNSLLGVCRFGAGYLDASPLGFNVGIPVENNLGNFTAEIVFPDGTPSWLTLGEIVNGGGFYNNAIFISAGENESGLPLQATLNLTSESNTSGTPNDFLSITQHITNTVNVYGSFQVANPDYVGGYGVDPSTAFITVGYTNSSGNGDWTDEGFLGTTTSEGTNYKLAADHISGFNLKAQLTFTDPNADQYPPSSGWVVIDTATNEYPTWITQSGSSLAAGMISTTFLTPDPNEGAEREALFTYIHPEDNTESGTFIVKQVGTYDPSVHTFDFKLISGSLSSGTATFSTASELTISNSAQNITLYGLHPITQNLGTYQETSSNAIAATVNANGFPLPWYQNLDMGDNTASIELIEGVAENDGLGMGDQFLPWITNLTCDYAANIINGEGASATFVTDVNNEINFIIGENNNVLSPAGSLANFPIARTFTLRGFNPYNQTNDPNDTILVTQEAKPYVQFVYSSGININENYSDSDGYTTSVKSNGTSTPTAKIFIPEYDADFGTFGTLTFPASLTTDNGWLSINSVGIASSSYTDNNGVVVGKQWPISFNIEENWTGQTRTAKVAVYHSSVSGDTLEDLGSPTETWGESDLINFTQQPTEAYLDVDPDSSMTTLQDEIGIAGDILVQLAQANSATQMENQYMAVALPLSYNGATPTIQNVEHQDESNSSFTSAASLAAVPWVASSSISSTELSLSFNHNSQPAATTRVVRFEVAHQNNTKKTTVQLMFQRS